MRIGMTYDLRDEYLAAGYSEEDTAEFDREDTVQAITAALDQLGHDVDRIGHVRQLVSRLADGHRWDLVFNICEGLHGIAREAQVPAILEAYDIPCTFADPLVLALSLHKGLTKAILQQAGLPTPPYRVVDRPEQVDSIDLPFPLFAKPLAEGTGKGISPASRVTDQQQLSAVCRQLLQRFHQPVIVETWLGGREFTVGLLGTGDSASVIGTLEILLLPEAEPAVYSYVNKEQSEELVEYRLVRPDADVEVAAAESIALAAWKTLNARDAGRIDLRSDGNGRPQFLEVNPLAGLHPQHSDLPMLANAAGMSYVELIDAIVRSASDRIQHTGKS